MKRLYIDFDGVVMDTIPPLYKAMEENNVDFDEEQQKREFFANFDFSTIINDESILNNSIGCIKKLIKSGKFEISFLTHINSLTEGVVKVEYLRRHFEDITIILVPKEISKTKMVHSEDAILIDDFSGNLEEWRDSGGNPVRFSKDLEDKGFPVLNRLDKLIEMTDKEGNLC